MKLMKVLTTISGLAVLVLLLPSGRLAAQNPDSAAVSQLLEEVKDHASVADDDAHTLASFRLAHFHWQTHADQLRLITDHVNNLIRDGNQLSSMRDEASPWQQYAIDHIGTLLPEMSAHLTATINHLKENLNQTQLPPYQDLLRTNENLIHNAHEIIADYVDYSKSRAKAEALEKQLQLPAASEPGS